MPNPILFRRLSGSAYSEPFDLTRHTTLLWEADDAYLTIVNEGAQDFGTSTTAVDTAATTFTGDVTFGVAGYLRYDVDGTFISKWDEGGAASAVWRLRADSGDLIFEVSADGSAVAASVDVPLAINTDAFFRIWHDATTNEIGISLNGDAAVTAAHATGTFSVSTTLNFNGYKSGGTIQTGASCILDSVWFTTIKLSDDDFAYFYNGGLGRNYSEIRSLPSGNSKNSITSRFYSMHEGSSTINDSHNSALAAGRNLTVTGTRAVYDGPIAGVVSAWADVNQSVSVSQSTHNRRPDYVRALDDIGLVGVGYTSITALIHTGTGKNQFKNIGAISGLIAGTNDFNPSTSQNPLAIRRSATQNRFAFLYANVGGSNPGGQRQLAYRLDGTTSFSTTVDSAAYYATVSGLNIEAFVADAATAHYSHFVNGITLTDDASSGVIPGTIENADPTAIWIGGNESGQGIRGIMHRAMLYIGKWTKTQALGAIENTNGIYYA